MLLTFGYVVVAASVVAALNPSPLELFTFPVIVTLWTGYLWIFTARSIRRYSPSPRSPRRVAAIIMLCGVVAVAALAASVVAGLFIVATRIR